MSFAAYSQNPVIDGCWWGSLDLGGDSAVDFLVSLAGSAAKGIDVVVGQNKAALKLSGISDAVADQYCKVLAAVYRDRIVGVTVDDPAALRTNLEKIVSLDNDWLTYFLKYDPSEDMKKINCPVFALNGSLDMQVLSRDNMPVIRENLPENPLNQIKEYDSLNHLFQHCTVQNSLNYAAIEETISAEVLNDISHWINSVK